MNRTVAALGACGVAASVVVLFALPAGARKPCIARAESFQILPTHLSVDGEAWATVDNERFTWDGGAVVSVSAGGLLTVEVVPGDAPNQPSPQSCAADAQRVAVHGLINPLTGVTGLLGASVFEAQP